RESAAQESLSRTEIAARSASAPTPGERRRWQVIGLLADGMALGEIVAATGYRPRTIREIAQRYRQFGPAALVDQRAHSQGAAPLLVAEQQHELRQALQNAPPDGGVWTGPKVAQWIAARIGRRVHRQRGWDYLRRIKDTGAPAHAVQPHDDDRDRPA
ncbi:MAG: helix-turn-helix domain-containing protein, partial [Chloroflexales bacterium]|nr:helix-turn-helix domain-containing protein [Chloroflexales bacterium]